MHPPAVDGASTAAPTSLRGEALRERIEAVNERIVAAVKAEQ